MTSVQVGGGELFRMFPANMWKSKKGSSDFFSRLKCFVFIPLLLCKKGHAVHEDISCMNHDAKTPRWYNSFRSALKIHYNISC